MKRIWTIRMAAAVLGVALAQVSGLAEPSKALQARPGSSSQSNPSGGKPSGPDAKQANVPPKKATFSAPVYKQADPKWGKELMGGGQKLQAKGCAVTSVAAALAGKGITINGAKVTPKTLNAWMKTHGAYQGNNIVWAPIAQLSSRIKFENRYTGNQSLKAATLRSYLDAGNKAIIADVGGHWILLTGHGGGSTFNCMDPGRSKTSYKYSDFAGYAVYTIRSS